MKIVELVYSRNGRVVGHEACRLRNEHVTLTGAHPTRQAELEALGFTVERRVLKDWPKWSTLMKTHTATRTCPVCQTPVTARGATKTQAEVGAQRAVLKHQLVHPYADVVRAQKGAK